MAGLCPDAFMKGPRTGKAPLRGNISPACIQIQLVLARYARHASKKPRRAPLGNTPREHLAAKGRFRRPKPPNHARRTNLATPPLMDLPLRRGSCPSSCIAGSSFNGLALAQGCLPPLGAAKGCAARDFPDRRRNACRAPLQQMLDAIALSTIESVLALNIRACLCWHKMEKWTRRGVSIAFRLPLF